MSALAVFGIENDGLNLAVNLLLLFLVVIYIALIYWTWADARRRIEDPMLVACATAASLFPFIGTVVYLIVRPPEFLEDARERELEIAAAEARLASLGPDVVPVLRVRRGEGLPALSQLPAAPEGALHGLRQAARPALEDLPLLRGRGGPGVSREPAPAAAARHGGHGGASHGGPAGTAGPGSGPGPGARGHRRCPGAPTTVRTPSGPPARRVSARSNTAPLERRTMDRTLILVKPDAFERGLTGEIVARFERKGLVIAAMKHMTVDRELAERHYAEHRERPFFGDLVDFITGGPLVALVLEGHEAVVAARQLIGATNPLESAPGSIRGDFGLEVQTNLVHGSDSPESAAREVGLFFPELGA